MWEAEGLLSCHTWQLFEVNSKSTLTLFFLVKNQHCRSCTSSLSFLYVFFFPCTCCMLEQKAAGSSTSSSSRTAAAVAACKTLPLRRGQGGCQHRLRWHEVCFIQQMPKNLVAAVMSSNQCRQGWCAFATRVWRVQEGNKSSRKTPWNIQQGGVLLHNN